jgi:AraC family transcriptional regulator
MNEAQTKPVIGGLAGWQARTIRQLAATQLRDMTVASLAQTVNLSPFHFSRAFRATFGVPPREWLLQQRLEQAKARLLESSETVEQIAASVGYRNGSQFARVFRARVGMSPQAFRRA